MRKLLLASFVALFVCGCFPYPPAPPPGPGPGDWLEITAFEPGVPAVLNFGDRLHVVIRYRMQSVDGVRIFARPYTNGKKTPGYRAHPSATYGRGEGEVVGWFTFSKVATVDEVRVEMVNAANNEVIAQISHEIEARWVAKLLIKPVKTIGQ